ncbi:hypothetical protein M8C13_30065 [Crossiella sp. SN42]|uniref:WXG100 family type VII secretion target n=1 Tax=Crossiella sp. SN42 TaxID=2944808 RepID=UPI00207C27FE|nr:hypothetical protein [Crossiella sp. SN42]MCO1580007.1 hypothetical protein [Crossiella sp. SN42]
MAHEDPVFEMSLQAIEQGKRQVIRDVETVRSCIGALMGFSPPLAIQYALSQQGVLGTEASAAVDKLNSIFDRPGSPAALRATGEAWTRHVGAVTDQLAGALRAERLATNDEWSGKAAKAYSDAVTLQNEALSVIKSITDGLHTSLVDAAAALESFWAALAAALKTLLWKLTLAIAACAGVATLPIGLGLAIEAASAFSDAMTSITQALTKFQTASAGQRAKLMQLVAGGKAYPDGSWPKVVPARLADASVKDGDDSQWEPS